MDKFISFFVRHNKNEKGSAALILLTAITTFTLLAGLSVATITLINGRITYAYLRSKEAYMVADACSEYVMLRIQKDPSYTTTSITLPTGTCTVAIVANGDNRLVTISAQKDNYYRTIQANINAYYYLVTLLEWKEL